MNADWKNRYEVAIDSAQNAAAIARQYFPDTTAAEFAQMIEWKDDNSPVSIADRAVEQSLRDDLLHRFPNDGFVGEEFGEKVGSSGFRWIIDPIDGTRSFVRGIPLWATLAGLEY